jgi:type I restriction enzyme, S subunit
VIVGPFYAGPGVPSESTRSGWRWHRLTDLARLATGHTPSRRRPDYWDGHIPWIQLPDIRALDGQEATDTSEHVSPLGIENSAAVVLPAGTVCLSRTASVGFVTVMGRDMATSQDFVNWVCGPDLDPHFLMHLFIACRKEIRDLGSGAVHHTIYFPTVESFSVCVPDVKEQRRIVAGVVRSLQEAKAALEAGRARLVAAEALHVAYLRDVFESAWPTVELRELCRTITDGTHLHPAFTESGIPFLFVRNIVAGTIDFNVEKYISEATYKDLTKRHKAENGDVLFSAVGSFGVAVVVRTDARFAFQRHIAHIKPDAARVDSDFLAYFLNSPGGRSQSEAVAMGGAQRTVTLTDLRKFRVPVPPLTEQQRVVAHLTRRIEAAHSLAAKCRDELAAVEAMPGSLLRAAFNGAS